MFELIVIVTCLLINAILAATEMAFVTVGKSRLREMSRSGNKEAGRILALRETPERTLSVIQVGITLVGAIGAAVGGAGADELLYPLLNTRLGLSKGAAEFIAILTVVIPITYFNVVIGELVPKTLALRDPTRIVLKTARWLTLFDRILAPIVNALEWSTKKLLQTFFKKDKVEPTTSPEGTVELDQLSQQARQYVLNIVGVEKMKVKDIRIPWEQVATIPAAASFQEVDSLVFHSSHTRLPVIENGQVIGILNTKEFIAMTKVKAINSENDWRRILHPIIRVQESDAILKAFRTMQENRNHVSVVFTGTLQTGIITLQDILEEVMGEIYDEEDDGTLKRILSSSATIKSITKKR